MLSHSPIQRLSGAVWNNNESGWPDGIEGSFPCGRDGLTAGVRLWLLGDPPLCVATRLSWSAIIFRWKQHVGLVKIWLLKWSMIFRWSFWLQYRCRSFQKINCYFLVTCYVSYSQGDGMKVFLWFHFVILKLEGVQHPSNCYDSIVRLRSFAWFWLCSTDVFHFAIFGLLNEVECKRVKITGSHMTERFNPTPLGSLSYVRLLLIHCGSMVDFYMYIKCSRHRKFT